MMAPPVESGLIAAAKEVAVIAAIDACKPLADFRGNRVQSWHNHCGCGTYPGKNTGGQCHDWGCGTFCHERRRGIRNQVNTV